MAKWLDGQIAELSKKINLTIEQFSKRTIKLISRKKLSQIFWPRIIGHSLTLIILILALFSLHARLFPEHEQLAALSQAVLADPFNPQPHQALGGYYLAQGYLQLAKSELTLATQLGLPEAENLYADIQRKKEHLHQEASFWENQLTDKPGYRDAYLKLASIYWQLREQEKAKKYLETAKKIDPNYEPVQELEKLLNSH